MGRAASRSSSRGRHGLGLARADQSRSSPSSRRLFDAVSIAFAVPGERVVTLRWDSPRQGKIAGYLVYRRRGGGREHLLTKKPFCLPADECGRSIAFANSGQPAAARAFYRLVAVGTSGGTSEATISVPAVGKGRARTGARSGPLAPANLSAETAPASAGLGLPDVLFFALFRPAPPASACARAHLAGPGRLARPHERRRRLLERLQPERLPRPAGPLARPSCSPTPT